MMSAYAAAGSGAAGTDLCRPAGAALQQVDKVVGQLGNP